jgi:ATPase subunit of ABC transporter with duplicated ATPase domains
MSVLKATNVSHGFGERTILENATFQLNKGEHVGLIGNNGEGKTTFLNIITGNIVPDSGKIEWAKHVTIGYLDQYTKLAKGLTIKEYLRTAFDSYFKMEQEMFGMYDKMATASEEEVNQMMEEIGEIQSELDASGFYNIDSKIEQVGNGLGLGDLGYDRDVTDLSGGQRSKVLLTKLLLENPMILILDEPTNYLDVEHINWLTNYLLNYENAFILVSHDIPFLNKVVNVIYNLEAGNMRRYTGNYETFMELHETELLHQQMAYDKQQKEIDKLEKFIAKNKARVATTDLAKSRQRRLDKMVILDKPQEQIKPSFRFNEAPSSGRFVVSLDNVVIGYDEPLTRPINLVIEKGHKVVIKGANGIGKSTLLKTMLGIIKPISGEVKLDYKLEVGYFEQEEVGSHKQALQEIWDMYPSMTQAEVRGALASCGLTKEKIESLMIVLSGGEQAKVRLCKIMIKETNCLVLDEPTNHLDNLAKEALKEVLQNYKGTIILVSHEPEFYDGLVDTVLNAEEWTLKIV